MTSLSTPSVDTIADPMCLSRLRMRAVATARACMICLLLAFCLVPINRAVANPVARANAAYARGDYVLVVKILTPLAFRGDPQAQAILGFMFENGYGAPQVYVTAADLYCQAAIRGNAFGQAMLGLMYDKGHGVPQDFILADKWLNLAAANAPKREREYFIRLRNAVASKMSSAQIAEAQRLALSWTAGQPLVPSASLIRDCYQNPLLVK